MSIKKLHSMILERINIDKEIEFWFEAQININR